MFRIATLLVAMLAVPSAALAEWNDTSPSASVGAGSTVTSVGKGQCVFETHLYTGQGSLLQAPVWPAMAQLNANISGTDEGDVQVEIRRCPPGTQSYSANICQKTEYKNAAGTVVSTIDGDTSEGTDAIYGMRSPVYVANVTTYPEQTSGDVTIVATATADGGSTTTLIDSGESWADDQWNGYRIDNVTEGIICEILDTVNSSQTIEVVATCTTWEDPTGDTYAILDGVNTLTDTSEDINDDVYNGDRIRNITTGEVRIIEDTDGTLESVTVTQPWDTEPEAADEYDILDITRSAEVAICVDGE